MTGWSDSRDEQIGRTTDLQRIQVSPRLFRIVDGTPFPQPNPAKLGEAEALSLRQTLGDSIPVNLMVSGSALVTALNDTTPHATQVQGLLQVDQSMTDSNLVAGRYFTASEGASGAPVVTISYRLASDFAHGRQPKDVVGDTLLFLGQRRAVVGVLKAAENDRSRRAIMPSRAVAGAVVTGPSERPAQLLVTSPTLEGVKPMRTQDRGVGRARVGCRMEGSSRRGVGRSRDSSRRRRRCSSSSSSWAR